jgi:PAS domain S-box-containing protein
MQSTDIAPPPTARVAERHERAEESAEEREERMNLALDSAAVGTWNWKVQSDTVIWDERMHDLFGVERGKFTGKYDSFATLLAPADRERVGAEVARAVKEGAPFDSQYRVIWPRDGSEHVIAARGKVYRDLSGEAVRMTGVCWDITDKRHIEVQLARERYLLRALIENIPDRIYFKDAQSRFIRINPALTQLFGLKDPQEAIGKTDFDYFSDEHAAPAFRDEQEVMRTGVPLIGKIERETMHDGRTAWALTTKMPLRDEHGKTIGTFGISRDITELHRADEALRESEERYARLLDSVTDYVYTVRLRNGEVLSTSHGPGCLAVTGYRPDEFDADPWLWHRIIHPDDRELVVENITRMIHEKTPLAIEHRLVRRDGTVRWVHNKQVAKYDSDRQLIAYDGLVSDITERRQAEAQVQEANVRLREVLADLTRSHAELKAAQMQLIEAEKMQSVGRLAAGVAHEVKNPLATLQMGLQCLLDEGLACNANVAPILTQMQEAVNRASTVIGDLLNLSSPRELKTSGASVNAVVERALRFVGYEAAPHRYKVERQLAADLPQCRIDPDKIEQVLINLLTNACDAMPEGGTITVSTSMRTLGAHEVSYDVGDRGGVRFRAGERVVAIEIADTGHGIPEEKMGIIFDPFYTSKPTGKGTGLGLSVARKIIELHKGQLEIRNATGGGVVATVLLKPE